MLDRSGWGCTIFGEVQRFIMNMKPTAVRIMSLVAIAMLALAVSFTLAARPKGGKGGKGGGGGGGNSGPSDSVNNVTPTTSPSDNSQAQQALRDMKDAESSIDQMYETSSAWLSAQAAIKQAQSDYDAACIPVIESLKIQPAYQAAVDAQTKAQADLTDMQANGSSAQVADAAQAAMQAKSAVKDLEQKAIATDPTAADAKSRLNAAYAALAELRQKEQEAVRSDPTWLAAKKQLDAARGG